MERSGFGEFLFYDWIRDGEIELEPNPILVAGRNFGCGSSREHAPWALEDFGFRAIIAPSFGDIFFTNCTKIGLLPVALTEGQCRELAAAGSGEDRPGGPDASSGRAARRASRSTPGVRHRLLNGLDDIGMTMQRADAIDAFEGSGAASLGPVTTAL